MLGPTLGGWLTDTYSWRYAFYINIPVGALAVFLCSDMAAGITGEILYVDNGFSTVGMSFSETDP